MVETAFKFDVAFSFVAKDEDLATGINDLLQDRLSTFLYSKQQEGLVGTDGEQTFSDVFGKQARVVVVLYRKEWGQTRWTRIEETAIKGRAFDEGYDFTLFIPLDDTHEVPKWLPKTRIWFDLARWGTSGAAAVVEQKARAARHMLKLSKIELLGFNVRWSMKANAVPFLDRRREQTRQTMKLGS